MQNITLSQIIQREEPLVKLDFRTNYIASITNCSYPETGLLEIDLDKELSEKEKNSIFRVGLFVELNSGSIIVYDPKLISIDDDDIIKVKIAEEDAQVFSDRSLGLVDGCLGKIATPHQYHFKNPQDLTVQESMELEDLGDQQSKELLRIQYENFIVPESESILEKREDVASALEDLNQYINSALLETVEKINNDTLIQHILQLEANLEQAQLSKKKVEESQELLDTIKVGVQSSLIPQILKGNYTELTKLIGILSQSLRKKTEDKMYFIEDYQDLVKSGKLTQNMVDGALALQEFNKGTDLKELSILGGVSVEILSHLPSAIIDQIKGSIHAEQVVTGLSEETLEFKRVLLGKIAGDIGLGDRSDEDVVALWDSFVSQIHTKKTPAKRTRKKKPSSPTPKSEEELTKSV